jgi:hypothetical protein
MTDHKSIAHETAKATNGGGSSQAAVTNDRMHHAEKAREYRSKAAACAEIVRTTTSLKRGAEARKKQRSYMDLAENEDWLADNSEKLVRAN